MEAVDPASYCEKGLRCFLAVFIVGLFNAPAAAVDNLKLLHRSGQTFLTSRKDATRTGEFYRIYRSTTTFMSSSSDLLPRKVIATLPEDTSLYYIDICRGVLKPDRNRKTVRQFQASGPAPAFRIENR